MLQQPLLYLSLYFKQNRDAYYDHLQRVRTEGAWEDWLAFFLEGVIAVASSATDTARRIRQLVERDRARSTGSAAAPPLRSVCTSWPVGASCSPRAPRQR